MSGFNRTKKEKFKLKILLKLLHISDKFVNLFAKNKQKHVFFIWLYFDKKIDKILEK